MSAPVGWSNRSILIGILLWHCQCYIVPYLVQVIWQLRTGNKTFLPRLGGGLLGIATSPADAACYIITQADNTIRMVSSQRSTFHPF